MKKFNWRTKPNSIRYIKLKSHPIHLRIGKRSVRSHSPRALRFKHNITTLYLLGSCFKMYTKRNKLIYPCVDMQFNCSLYLKGSHGLICFHLGYTCSQLIGCTTTQGIKSFQKQNTNLFQDHLLRSSWKTLIEKFLESLSGAIRTQDWENFACFNCTVSNIYQVT